MTAVGWYSIHIMDALFLIAALAEHLDIVGGHLFGFISKSKPVMLSALTHIECRVLVTPCLSDLV